METEILRARQGPVRIRRGPFTMVEINNFVRQINTDDTIAVIGNLSVLHEQSGWVWRRVIGDEEHWIAEYNIQTGARLLVSTTTPSVESFATFESTTAGEVSSLAVLHSGGRVRVDRGHGGFICDEKPLRFVGANLREFVFYGQSLEKVQHTTKDLQEIQLSAAQDMGMRVVRFHVCHKDVPLDKTLPLISEALDAADRHNLLVIACLNDALGHSHFYIPGDDAFHFHDKAHLDKTTYFHNKGYEQNYLPFVKTVVEQFKDHPAIFAWELGNEYAIHPQPATVSDADAFLNFCRVVSGHIRDLDKNHLITTGLINSNQFAPAGSHTSYAQKLYGMDTIDFATVHFYEHPEIQDPAKPWNEEDASVTEINATKALGKPLIVEEFAAIHGDRANSLNQKITTWEQLGAVGFLQWGLSATDEDKGVGDAFGMARYGDHRHHYTGLVSVLSSWAGRFAVTD